MEAFVCIGATTQWCRLHNALVKLVAPITLCDTTVERGMRNSVDVEWSLKVDIWAGKVITAPSTSAVRLFLGWRRELESWIGLHVA